MSARYGIWFATGPEAVVGLTGRLAALLGLEFNANDQEQTVTAVGEGVSWDLSWGHDLEDDRDMPLSRYPVVLEFRPWSPMADADHLEAVRGAFDAVRGWGLPAMLLWDAQRLVDRFDGPGDADRRASVLVDLIALRTPLDEALAAVRALPWDSDADLAVVRRADVRSSLGRSPTASWRRRTSSGGPTLWRCGRPSPWTRRCPRTCCPRWRTRTSRVRSPGPGPNSSSRS